jgi:hypothetical protein
MVCEDATGLPSASDILGGLYDDTGNVVVGHYQIDGLPAC